MHVRVWKTLSGGGGSGCVEVCGHVLICRRIGVVEWVHVTVNLSVSALGVGMHVRLTLYFAC